MPAQTACAYCGTVGFVRWERVIAGTVAAMVYTCGRCQRVWRTDDEPTSPHAKLKTERRTRTSD